MYLLPGTSLGYDCWPYWQRRNGEYSSDHPLGAGKDRTHSQQLTTFVWDVLKYLKNTFCCDNYLLVLGVVISLLLFPLSSDRQTVTTKHWLISTTPTRCLQKYFHVIIYICSIGYGRNISYSMTHNVIFCSLLFTPRELQTWKIPMFSILIILIFPQFSYAPVNGMPHYPPPVRNQGVPRGFYRRS